MQLLAIYALLANRSTLFCLAGYILNLFSSTVLMPMHSHIIGEKHEMSFLYLGLCQHFVILFLEICLTVAQVVQVQPHACV